MPHTIETPSAAEHASPLQAAALEALFEASHEHRYSPGEAIVRQGEPGDALYLILEGYAEVVRALKDGRRVVVSRLGPGEHFGERALMPGRPGLRTADVIARTDMAVASVGREAFQALLAQDHPLRARLQRSTDAQLMRDLAHESALVRSLQRASEGVGQELHLADGQLLFEQGDPADALYLVLEGQVGVFVDGALRATLGEGGCLGELGLMERAPRSATARALGPGRLLRVCGAHFAALTEGSEQLRALLQTLQRVYRLPHRGVLTQHSGTLQGRPAVTHVFDLPDGRRVVASRVLGEDVYQADQTDSAAAQSLGWTSPERGLHRALRLDAEGRLIGITAHGPWPGLAELHRRLLDGQALEPALLRDFEASGALNFDAGAERGEALLCACVPTRRRQVDEAVSQGHTSVEALRATLGCGSVCGACVPGLRHILGNEQWTPVRLERHTHAAEGVRAFSLRPIHGAPQAFLPGQHVVVSGLVEGEWVQRAYTLSSPCEGAEAYEIIVKREPQGLFSRWLCNRASADHLLRVSPPRGDFFWQPVGRPAVCFVAGIGVTPALAMLRARAARGWSEPLHVDYTVRARSQAVALEELSQAGEGVSFTWRASAEAGRLQPAEVAELVRRFPKAEFFLCGPDAFMEAVQGMLREAGVRGRDIYVESFAPAEAKLAPKGQEDPAPEPKRGIWGRLVSSLLGR